ncbi:MAG: ArsR/SmtB family transcription factor [Candidatus Methanomethylophilaceae archaeon]|jgi:ArsR family transcriptional regulator
MNVDVFKAFSDANRLKILEILADEELCACKIQENLNITQPTLSHHMSTLQKGGLVNVRKSGQWSHYSINVEALNEVIAYVSSLIPKADRADATSGCESDAY